MSKLSHSQGCSKDGRGSHTQLKRIRISEATGCSLQNYTSVFPGQSRQQCCAESPPRKVHHDVLGENPSGQKGEACESSPKETLRTSNKEILEMS